MRSHQFEKLLYDKGHREKVVAYRMGKRFSPTEHLTEQWITKLDVTKVNNPMKI